MESKNKKEELEIRKASSYDINFPDNKYLETQINRESKRLLLMEVFQSVIKLLFLKKN